MEAIRKHNTLNMSKSDWLAHRKEGIGCSEVSSVMGLNKYQSSLELFYDKLSEVEEKPTSVPAWMGGYLEDCVADLYKYWEKDQETMQLNYDSGKKINTIRRVNAILTNPKYPYLLGNLDREQIKPFKAVVEIKTTSSFVLDKWTAGIPPMYIVQSQAYMMITGYDIAKLCVLKDGRYLDVFDIVANEKIQSNIAEACKSFWERIEIAKSLKAQGRPFESLEPEPDGSEAYEQFLRAKFKSKPVRVEGTAEQYQVSLEYLKLNEQIKSIESDKQARKNILLNALREAETITFGLSGYVSWKENEKGIRTFQCKVKQEKK